MVLECLLACLALGDLSQDWHVFAGPCHFDVAGWGEFGVFDEAHLGRGCGLGREYQLFYARTQSAGVGRRAFGLCTEGPPGALEKNSYFLRKWGLSFLRPPFLPQASRDSGLLRCEDWLRVTFFRSRGFCLGLFMGEF